MMRYLPRETEASAAITQSLSSGVSNANSSDHEISANSNNNFEKPFLYLARKLAGDSNLHFVKSPALAPPEVQISIVLRQHHEAELAEAVNQPLPDE